ncbi:MAG: radical SAM protein, partial [Anaerolineae bacterium]|nr:radical SAM protein [Anaerolineae bacterium]
MNIRYTQAKSILTPQARGFLTSGERPYTHSLSWAAGCGYGKLYCGAFCYAQMLPNWHFARRPDERWGEALIIKENAAELLEAQLSRARNRRDMRIFMSPVTDPYQPIERKLRLTRRCLEVFARYDDLDLLLIQTRGPAVLDDLDLIARIPYAWLGMTIETDRHDLP